MDIKLQKKNGLILTLAMLFVGTLSIASFAVSASNNVVIDLAKQNVSGNNYVKSNNGIQFKTTTTTPLTTTVPSHSNHGTVYNWESLRNNNAKFEQDANVPSANLDLSKFTTSGGAGSPHPSGEGQFRTYCSWSHFNQDDPIVYPGKQNAAHLHMFFGNTKTNYATTTDSLVNSGGGSCEGFAANRTGYWVPAMFANENEVVLPRGIVIYYKTQELRPVNAFKEMPQGLRMISGDASAVAPQENGYYRKFKCALDGNVDSPQATLSQLIPDCKSGILRMIIVFPNCWNGELDSADHKSHMAFGVKTCPASHPYMLPQIEELVDFVIPAGTSTKNWYLSSDRSGGKNLPGGTTLHGDWLGGWNNEIMKTWTENCIRAGKNCSPGQLGTGRILAGTNDVVPYKGPLTMPITKK